MPLPAKGQNPLEDLKLAILRPLEPTLQRIIQLLNRITTRR
jgi:hypothetical protein